MRVHRLVGAQAHHPERVGDLAVRVDLALRRGAVAGADGRGGAVALQVGELRLGQVGLAADAVHDLEVLDAGGQGDHLQPVQPGLSLVDLADPAQGAERQRGIAQPGVAVVPVAGAADALGQRGRGGGDDRAGRLVLQALQRERRALDDLGAGRREVQPGAPLAPVGDGAVQGVREVRRAGAVEGQREAVDVALDDRPPLAGALHAVGDDRVAVGELADEPAEPALPGDGAVLAVVGAWVADDLDLDGAADALEAAAHRLARADVQPVGQADGARRRGERRLDDVGLRQVAALDGDVADRPDAPGAAALRVQQRGEDRRAVEARPAEPVDRPVGRDECRRSAVGEEGVVADRGVAGGVARGSQIAWNRGRERRAKHPMDAPLRQPDAHE